MTHQPCLKSRNPFDAVEIDNASASAPDTGPGSGALEAYDRETCAPLRGPTDNIEDSQHRLAPMARLVLAARRERTEFFPAIGFGEPAWDVMLDLYLHYVSNRSVTVSSLCVAAAVPPSTALRRIDLMVDAGQLVRRPDPSDRRCALITLSPQLIEAIEAYLRRIHGLAIKAFE